MASTPSPGVRDIKPQDEAIFGQGGNVEYSSLEQSW